MKKIGKLLAIVLAIATMASCLCLALVACDKGSTSEPEGLEKYAITVQTESKDPNNELIMVTSADFPPFEQILGTNKFYGIDVEIAKLIADTLGKTLVIKNQDYDSIWLDVEENPNFQYDIIAAAITKTEERDLIVDFSDTYFNTTQTIIVKANNTTFDACKDADDLEAVIKGLTGNAAKCGAQQGTTGGWYINGGGEYDGFDNLDYSPYVSPALAVEDMKNGNINFVVVDEAVAKALADQYDGIKVVNVKATEEKYAFVVKEGNKTMQDAINNVLKTKATEVQAILDKYLAE